MSNENNKTGVHYGNSSIDQLLGAERVRRRPAAMLGSSGIDGARHGFTEIYGNALDEVTSGYGDRLDVKYYKDGSISIRDYGRGVPLGWNTNLSAWNWHIIYNELYGGGKYTKNQDKLREIKDWSSFNELDYNYLYSVGLNGLGAASTQYTSEFFEVHSYRDGKVTKMRFEKGLPIINGVPVNVFREQVDMEALEPIIEDTDEPNGTFVWWKPDSDVFTDTDVTGKWLLETCESITNVAHVNLNFIDEQTGIEKNIPAGNLETLVGIMGGNSLYHDDSDNPVIFSGEAFSHGTTRVEQDPNYIWVCKLAFSIGITEKNVPHRCFHNAVRMASGIQYSAVDWAIRTFFTDIARQRGIKLEESDYKNIFTVAISTYSNYASFRSQTKDAVDNDFIHDLIYDAITKKLTLEYGKGNKHILACIERVIADAQVRIATREYMNQARIAKKATKQTKDPEKFLTSKAYIKKDYANSELWIAEGDSASGAIKQARNSDFQAVIHTQGKFLNTLKASLDKILKNKIIMDIISVIGAGMDIGEELFDISKCRFSKIIIATDADVDGYQIRVLVFNLFYSLCPKIITDGRLFIAETPRFEIVLFDGTREYARDDKERDELLKEHGGNVKGVNRFKGLGEMNADTLRLTTVHPDTRRLVPVTLDMKDKFTIDLIDAMFGMDKMRMRRTLLIEALGADVAEFIEENDALLSEIDALTFDEETEVQAV